MALKYAFTHFIQRSRPEEYLKAIKYTVIYLYLQIYLFNKTVIDFWSICEPPSIRVEEARFRICNFTTFPTIQSLIRTCYFPTDFSLAFRFSDAVLFYWLLSFCSLKYFGYYILACYDSFQYLWRLETEIYQGIVAPFRADVIFRYAYFSCSGPPSLILSYILFLPVLWHFYRIFMKNFFRVTLPYNFCTLGSFSFFCFLFQEGKKRISNFKVVQNVWTQSGPKRYSPTGRLIR